MPDEETTLFVYGSLVEKDRRDEVIGHEVETAPARIRNYERRRGAPFRGTDGALTLTLSRSSQGEG
jgi:hypothetical protein